MWSLHYNILNSLMDRKSIRDPIVIKEIQVVHADDGGTFNTN